MILGTDLSVTGLTTFTGLADFNGGASIDNIQLGVTSDNEIDTSTGGLTLDSAGGIVTVDDNLTVTGDLSLTGNFNGSSVVSVSYTHLTLPTNC